MKPTIHHPFTKNEYFSMDVAHHEFYQEYPGLVQKEVERQLRMFRLNYRHKTYDAYPVRLIRRTDELVKEYERPKQVA